MKHYCTCCFTLVPLFNSNGLIKFCPNCKVPVHHKKVEVTETQNDTETRAMRSAKRFLRATRCH